MFPVGNKPVIHHLVERLAESGIKEIVIAVNPQKKIIQQYLKDGSDFNIHINYVTAPSQGIDKALWSARRHLNRRPFLYCVGDVFIENSNIFKTLLSLFTQHQEAGILILKRTSPSQLSNFAVPVASKKTEGLWNIQSFVEKPKPSNAPSSFASVGIMILPPSFFETMPAPKTKGEVQLSHYLNLFIQARGPLLGYETKKKIYDCGNIREFAAANASQSKI